MKDTPLASASKAKDKQMIILLIFFFFFERIIQFYFLLFGVRYAPIIYSIDKLVDSNILKKNLDKSDILLLICHNIISKDKN